MLGISSYFYWIHYLSTNPTPNPTCYFSYYNQTLYQKPSCPLVHPSQIVCWSQKVPSSSIITSDHPHQPTRLFIHHAPSLHLHITAKISCLRHPFIFLPHIILFLSFSFLLHHSLTVASFNQGLYWEWLHAWLTRSWTPLHQWRTLPARFQCIQLTCTPCLHI